MKTMALQRNSITHIDGFATLYVTIVGHGEEKDHDWQVDFDLLDAMNQKISVTDLESGKKVTAPVEWNRPNSAFIEMWDPTDEDSYDSIQYIG